MGRKIVERRLNTAGSNFQPPESGLGFPQVAFQGDHTRSWLNSRLDNVVVGTAVFPLMWKRHYNAGRPATCPDGALPGS